MENRENNTEIFDGNTTFSYAFSPTQLFKRHVNTERPGTEANIRIHVHGYAVLLCFVVCFTLLASFFLSSASLINMYQCFFSAFLLSALYVCRLFCQ